MEDLARELADMRVCALASQRREDADREEEMATRLAENKRDHEFMLNQLRPATPAEYSEWVSAYMRQGGRAFRFWDRPMTNMYVALAHLSVVPTYGAMAMGIIIPRGLTDDGGLTGHAELFTLTEEGAGYRGFHNITEPHAVTVFSDTTILPARTDLMKDN